VTGPDGPPEQEFLSGRVGYVGPRRSLVLRAADRALDGLQLLRAVPRRLDTLAREAAPTGVLVLSAYRPSSEDIDGATAELRTSRHRVRLAYGSTGAPLPALADVTVARDLSGGKFQNLNEVLATAGRGEEEWVLVIDDDVELPAGFLDRLVAIAARLDLDLAQPALRLASHGAWEVTRRRPRPLARETCFVEIGPVTLFGRAAAELLPFPNLRFGWGLDLHWAALARERGWRLGIVDALAIRHRGSVASAYSADDAVSEARRFLAERPFLRAAEAGEVLAEHRDIG
jgi:hypothetical protein